MDGIQHGCGSSVYGRYEYMADMYAAGQYAADMNAANTDAADMYAQDMYAAKERFRGETDESG